MPNTLLLPDIRNKLADLARRIGVLERRIREQTTPATDLELVFSLPGALTLSTSPKGYVRTQSRLVNVLCALGIAGSSTTTVQIKKNGTTIGTITLGSGDTLERARFSVGFLADTDALTVTISGVGTGAADLTVQARFG